MEQQVERVSIEDWKDFTFLGFDFRVPSGCPKTVDACLWEQAGNVYKRVLNSGCQENFAQLLECLPSEIEGNVSPNAIGVAIAISPSGYLAIQEKLKWPMSTRPLSPLHLAKRNWVFEGYDVADIDGYFSVFGIDSAAPRLNAGTQLFKTMREAQSFVLPATELYPSHAPFAVFAIFTYANA